MSACGGSGREIKSLMGFRVWPFGARACVDELLGGLDAGRRTWVACLNPHSFVVSRHRSAFRAALEGADLLVPDGVGILAASRLLRGNVRERVTGYDIFEGVNAGLEGRGGGRVFLLGGSRETLERMRSRLGADWPCVQVVGTYAPPFVSEFSAVEKADMVARVNAVQPDVLWVGLSAPKQEELVWQLLPSLDVKVAGCVGAVFDFYAGSVRRAGRWFQRCGLEWLPRLLREPRRLWRRTLISGPQFVWLLMRASVRGPRGREFTAVAFRETPHPRWAGEGGAGG